MTNTGKLAIVTGAGRTRGLGAGICRKLAEKGADVLFTYWGSYDAEMPYGEDFQGPDRLEAEIREMGRQCEGIEVDLTDVGVFEAVFAEAKERFGRAPDILVNNAAVSINDTIETVLAEALDRHYEVNVRAVTLLTQQFIRHFDKKEGGRIVNITTGWSQGPMPDELSYVLTKSTSETLVYTLQSVLAKKGITINAINPGPTDTGWMSDDVKKGLGPLFPQGRIGLPEDAANLVAFLTSDDAKWVTGQVIHSEGGFMN
ncbi:SDR family oxidoreductase [Bacillus sp. H-16]|uniref:SDR family oxidoreductase n=1 Tax=Alteribacter salitolerans TaxID=2912333 RepID=UPI0019625718|nr:SDR family oxidoreductase [Alteribacter salitolerans]MBM7097871.1 SDR family oxidoreductase [Alteribacter salitolerans]